MPYINTIDINGEIYNLGNLTDGDYVVDLPSLQQDDVFVVQGDIINNLTSNQGNKPLSANQGRVINGKIADLGTQISNLKQQSEAGDATINSTIESLRSDMNNKDTETLSSAKTYSDGLKTQLDSKDTELDGKITQLQQQTNENNAELNAKVVQLSADMTANDEATLSNAKEHTDSRCTLISSNVSKLTTTVNTNKKAADNAISSLQTYVNSTFITKTNIADNLTTDSADNVLSAKQGKVLEDNKFDKAGGTIAGAVTLNGDLSMGNTNGISIIKEPTLDNDVVNKKYVDDKLLGAEVLIGGISTKTLDVSTPSSGGLSIQVGSTNARLGAAQISADSLNMGETLISNVKDPVSANDVATKGYVDNKKPQIEDGTITKQNLASDAISYIDDLIAVDKSENWTYVKMRNGVAMAWRTCVIEMPLGQDNLNWSMRYPVGFFISRPVCNISVSSDSEIITYKMRDTGSSNMPPRISLYRDDSGSYDTTAIDAFVDYFAIGKWK